MTPVRPHLILIASLGLGLAGPAHALSCDEIVAMVDVGVPHNIVIQTIQDAAGLYEPDEIACLVQAEVPEVVLDATRTLERQPDATHVPPLEVSSTSSQATPSHRLGDDRTFERQATNTATPPEIEQAIKLGRAHKPLSASLALSELLEDDRYPDRTGQLHYYLARNLQDLGMMHSAGHHYLSVVKRGTTDPWFDHALVRLVGLADLTGDMTDLKRVVAKLPADTWPRRTEATLTYLQGLRMLEQEDLSHAQATLARVPTHSPHGLRARYLEGIIHNRTGRPKSAVRAFREVVQTEVEAPTRSAAQRSRELKNQAMLGVARIHYAVELFDRAEGYYSMVEPASHAWPTARLEQAWAQFMQNDTGGSLGQILTVRSPFFAGDPFQPEADVLRALNHYTLCEWGEVERITVDFEDRTRPLQQELHSFVKRYASPEGRQLADQAWDTYFEDFPADSVLSLEIFDHMLRNRDLAAQAQRLEGIDAELTLIGDQKARWRDGMEPVLQAVLVAERHRTRRRAGLLLLAEAAELSTELGELLVQSELIRFEANDGLRRDIDWLVDHAEDDGLMSVAEAEIPYATNGGEVYWPFNGEFWEDELGSYVYVGESACR